MTWKTISETNNFGFEIDRRRDQTSDWIKIAFVEGHGTTVTPQSYSYINRSVPLGKYYYRIKQIDLDGQSKEYPEMEATVGAVPNKFVLAQNYPNPFNPSTTISYDLPVRSFVTLKIYNVIMQEVATLASEEQSAGRYSAKFQAAGLASGVYYYRILARPVGDGQGGEFVASSKMMLIK